MPFTPTHIAAVLPFSSLSGRRLPFSALVIGSQIPDLPLYLPSFLSHFGERVLHTVEGLIAGCLPLGLLGYLWFQAFAKEPLFHCLPLPLRQRLQEESKPHLQPSYGFFAFVLIAVGLGATTHILWDSFTHYGDWGFQLLPDMDRIALSWGSFRLERYKALQYGSTFVVLPPMLLGLLWWLWRHPVRPSPTSPIRDQQRLLCQVTLVLLPVLAALAWSTVDTLRNQSSARAFTVQALTTLGMLQFLAINAVSVWYWHRKATPETR